MNATITLREYLAKEKTFVVPRYQRGYVWGKGNRGKHKDAATYMMDSLINATGFISSKNAYIYNRFTCCDNDGKAHLLPSPVWSVRWWGAAHNTNCVVFENINGLKLDVRYLSKKDGSGTLQVETKPVNENISEHMEYFNKVVSTLMIPTLYEKDMPSFDLLDIHAEVQRMMDNIDSVK